MDIPDFDGESMVDTLFSFIDPIVDPVDENWFIFIAGIESVFETPERFQAEYERISRDSGLTEEEKQKKLDLYIGLSLIGQHGREQMFERLRLMRDSQARP